MTLGVFFCNLIRKGFNMHAVCKLIDIFFKIIDALIGAAEEIANPIIDKALSGYEKKDERK